MKSYGRIFNVSRHTKGLFHAKRDLHTIKDAIDNWVCYFDDTAKANGFCLHDTFVAYLKTIVRKRGGAGITSDDVARVVAQVVQFKQGYGYTDAEVADCFNEAAAKGCLYLKEIRNLKEYRDLKQLAKEKADKATDKPLATEKKF